MSEESVQTPLTQLSEYCACEEVSEADVDELINLISAYTCWTQKPCETFLQSERKEVIELPNCVTDCDVFEFEPFYHPFDEDSFTFTLIEQSGITETPTEISSYLYSETDEKFRLELPLPSCKCRVKCGCESKYKLLVTYVAGYETIPECLLPFMCEALRWINDKNNCGCEDCAPCNSEPNTIEGVIDYTTLNGRLQDNLLSVLTKQYFKQISLISLCNGYKGDLWGVIA